MHTPPQLAEARPDMSKREMGRLNQSVKFQLIMVPSAITPHRFFSGNRGRERPSRWSSVYLGDVGLEPATVCSRGNRSSTPHH